MIFTFSHWFIDLVCRVVLSALLIIGTQYTSTGQSNLDSLRQLFEAAEGDSLKYERVRKYEQATRKVDRVAALPLMKERVRYAEKVGNDDWLMKSYLTLGNNYMYLSKLDSAEIYLEHSIELSDKLGQNAVYNAAANSLALLYQTQNEFEEAIGVYHKVLVNADSIKDIRTIIGTRINLGLLLMEQEEFDRAITYLSDVESLYNSIDIENEDLIEACKPFLTSGIGNLGLCYMELLDEELALKNLSKALLLIKDEVDDYSKIYLKSYLEMSLAELSLRSCVSKLHCTSEKLLDIYNQSIRAKNGFEQIAFNLGLAESKVLVGRVLLKKRSFGLAEEVLMEGVQMAQELELIDLQSKGAGALAELYEKKGLHKVANELLKKQFSLNDSIRNRERDKVWQNLEKKYETAQKENEILSLKLENEQKTRRQNRQTFGFIISLLSLLGGGYFIYSRYKIKKERELAQFERDVNTAMSRFVPMSFIRAIGRDEIMDVELGDKVEKEVTVLFTDIRGFTSISEDLTPGENFDFVMEYAGLMGPIIESNDGFINQYLGDGIMAIFDQSSSDALRACIGMQSAISEYNIDRIGKGLQPIRVGMGMHTGPLILGIIGDQIRRDATIISDTVNSAARIESTTKMYDYNILMSDTSYAGLIEDQRKDSLLIGDIEVKGKNELIRVYAYNY